MNPRGKQKAEPAILLGCWPSPLFLSLDFSYLACSAVCLFFPWFAQTLTICLILSFSTLEFSGDLEMLIFVLNLSGTLSTGTKCLLTSWSRHEFYTLVDICFCGKGLPPPPWFSVHQVLCFSSDWWNLLCSLNLENQFLYQWKKAGLAWKHQALMYVAICSIFLFIFYSCFHRHLFLRFSGQISGEQLLQSSFFFTLKYWCCTAILQSHHLSSLLSPPLPAVLLQIGAAEIRSLHDGCLRNQGLRVVVSGTSTSSPCLPAWMHTAFCTLIHPALWYFPIQYTVNILSFCICFYVLLHHLYCI